LEVDHVFALPHASCLSTFQAPGSGIPAVFPPHRWRNATPWELVPFSHCSASRIFIMQSGCTPPPAVTQDGDLQLDGGGKRAGLQPLPLPQPQGFSSPGLGRGVCRVGVGPCMGGGPLLHSVIGGKGGRRLWRWQLQRAWLSEPLTAPASATAAVRGSPVDEIARAAHGPSSNSTAFCPSLPHKFGHGRGPSSSSTRPEVSAAAVQPPGAEVVVVAAAGAGDGAPFVGLLLLRRPSPMEWGCSYLQRGNRSSVCNGTLNASVFVHYGCRGLNMCVILAQSRVFSSFSSTKTRLLVV
jgi:hypothetical protein